MTESSSVKAAFIQFQRSMDHWVEGKMDYDDHQAFLKTINDYTTKLIDTQKYTSDETRALYKLAERTLAAHVPSFECPPASRLSTLASRESDTEVTTALCMWLLINKAVSTAFGYLLDGVMQDRQFSADLSKLVLPFPGIDTQAPDGRDPSRKIIGRVYELCEKQFKAMVEPDLVDDARANVLQINSQRFLKQLYEELHKTEDFKTWREQYPFFQLVTISPGDFWDMV